MSELDRKRALDLLEANHAFPGEYPFSVIARNAESVTEAVMAAAGAGLDKPLGPEAHQIRQSSGGKYLSHRLTVPVAAAEEVLTLYTRLRSVEGVITVF